MWLFTDTSMLVLSGDGALEKKSYKSSLAQQLKRSALKDLLICLILIALLTLFTIEIDAVELLYQLTRDYEHWDLDELLLGVFWFIAISVFYLVRRFVDYRDLNNTMSKLAYFDPFTGLPNRIMLQERINQLVAAAGRNQQVFCLLFIDFDDFKQVNDNYGHDVGDELLQSFSQRIKHDIRGEDLLARIGGDEFVLLTFPGDKEQDESTLAMRLLEMQQQVHHVGQYQLKVSLSIGIARYPGDGNDFSSLLKAADKAMYQSKAMGKEQYCYYSGLQENQRA